MVLGVAVLFVVIDVALRHGLQPVLESLVGTGTAPADLVRVAGSGALTANVVNNLPAYIALESVSSDAPAAALGAARRSQRRTTGDAVGVPRHAAVGAALPRGRPEGEALDLARQGLVCALAAAGLSVAALALAG